MQHDSSNNDGDSNAEKVRTLFVGGLDGNTTEETLCTYFKKWGKIVDCVLIKNRATNTSYGFGFITYKNAKQLDAVLKKRSHTIDNRTVATRPMLQYANEESKDVDKNGLDQGATGSGQKGSGYNYGDYLGYSVCGDYSLGNSDYNEGCSTGL